MQIPYFLGRETIQPNFKLGKKFRRKQLKCVQNCVVDYVGKKLTLSEKYIPLSPDFECFVNSLKEKEKKKKDIFGIKKQVLCYFFPFTK